MCKEKYGLRHEATREIRSLLGLASCIEIFYFNSSMGLRLSSIKYGITYDNYSEDVEIHSSVDLAKVSDVAYVEWTLSLDVSECKQSGPSNYINMDSFETPALISLIIPYFFLNEKRCSSFFPTFFNT